jgi:magnesium chelatase subunit D
MSKKHNAQGNSKRAGLRPRAKKSAVYPFAAIVGQAEMKLALLLNVIDPSIGGVLIMGHRGTGKSTAVRALADLLPQIRRVRDCFYACDPFDEENLCDDCFARLNQDGKLQSERALVTVVDLPLGATEDRVCGTINIERALREGIKSFEPGLLARANRGFLYIDEVNLLEDHLIDLLLDVAVTGRNLVEREGVSIEHPARFVLVGSGNPEEGDLRPQLLDRFGLQVEVKTASDLDERVEIVERREAFERDTETFCSLIESDQESLRRKLSRARKTVAAVKLSRKLLRRIAELCQQLKIDGHRGEIIIARAARALAAFEGRREVSSKDVRRVAMLALSHRLRRDPFDGRGGNSSRIEQSLDKLFPQEAIPEKRSEMEPDRAISKSSSPGNDEGRSGAGEHSAEDGGGSKNIDEENAPAPVEARLSENNFDALSNAQPKKRTPHQSKHQAQQRSSYNKRGRYTRSTSIKPPEARIALDATIRAGIGGWGLGIGETVAWAKGLSTNPQPPTPIPHQALRYKRFKRKSGTLFIFAVDTSGSMALNRIAQARGALVRLLQQSYVRRDRVALLTFRGTGAELLLSPSGSVTRAKALLDELSVGGATPLAAGLLSALEVAARARREGVERIALLLFTDGRANVPLSGNGELEAVARRRVLEEELRMLGAHIRQAGVSAFIVDTQNRFTSNGEGQRLAEMTGARYLQLSAVEKL